MDKKELVRTYTRALAAFEANPEMASMMAEEEMKLHNLRRDAALMEQVMGLTEGEIERTAKETGTSMKFIMETFSLLNQL